MIVIGERALEYVSRKLDYHPHHEATAIGIERNGRVIAGAVFSCFTGADIDITIAAEPRYFSRGFMRAMAHYVYEQSGCIRASFMTELPHVVTVLEKAGAKVEGVKRNAYGPGRDGVMLGLLREEWEAHTSLLANTHRLYQGDKAQCASDRGMAISEHTKGSSAP